MAAAIRASSRPCLLSPSRRPAWGYSPQLAESGPSAPKPFDPYRVKRDFPILQQQVHGKPLVWLDNAATT